ncbi:MAG: TRAP transporter small permease [Nitratireductor sp.]|nr:TRAP transporter small permease [Nitratireductor sp.]
MIRRLADAVLVFGATLGAICIWAIGAIVTYDVILRFLGMPTLWALEFSTYLMIGAATLGSGLAVIRGDHFAVDILPMAMPPRPRRWLSVLTTFVCLGLILFVTYGFWQLIALSVRLDMKSATIMRIPLVYPQSIVFFGFALMVLAFLYKAVFGRN